MTGEIARNLEGILLRINSACKASGRCATPRLVAVSKTKSIEVIEEAIVAGQMYFGENYISELVSKAVDPRLDKARWHFIGHCQSNKLKQLLAVPNLCLVETLHSAKMAAEMQRRWPELRIEPRPEGCDDRLDVLLQVNTSGEQQKNGVSPEDVVPLALQVYNECPALRLRGLMTIGSLSSSSNMQSEGNDNKDFVSLIECRGLVASALSISETELELSMGMSADFESAIMLGSTNIRVGSSIFGSR